MPLLPSCLPAPPAHPSLPLLPACSREHEPLCGVAAAPAQQQPGAHRQYTPMRQPGRQPPAPPASASANLTCSVWPSTEVPSRVPMAACASPGLPYRTKPYLQWVRARRRGGRHQSSTPPAAPFPWPPLEPPPRPAARGHSPQAVFGHRVANQAQAGQNPELSEDRRDLVLAPLQRQTPANQSETSAVLQGRRLGGRAGTGGRGGEASQDCRGHATRHRLEAGPGCPALPHKHVGVGSRAQAASQGRGREACAGRGLQRGGAPRPAPVL